MIQVRLVRPNGPEWFQAATAAGAELLAHAVVGEAPKGSYAELYQLGQGAPFARVDQKAGPKKRRKPGEKPPAKPPAKPRKKKAAAVEK
jgi:hypothetical protein